MQRRTLAARRTALAAGIAIAMLLAAQTATAWPPQASVGTGMHSTSDNYFSQTGVNFGFSIPTSLPNGGSGVVGLTQQGGVAQNIMFQQGGQANIPFGLGPSTPSTSFGYAVKTPMGTMYFGLTSSLGSDRSNMGQSGSITMMDGGTGFLSDTSQSPFVTSIVPVVGNNGQSVLGERLQRLAAGEGTTNQAQLPPAPRPDPAPQADPARRNSTLGPDAPAVQKAAAEFERRLSAAQDKPASQPPASLAEIRAQQAAADQAVNEEYGQKVQMAEAALADGKPGVARLYYQQVVRHANGALKQRAIEALKTLAATPTSAVGNALRGVPPAPAVGSALRGVPPADAGAAR